MFTGTVQGPVPVMEPMLSPVQLVVPAPATETLTCEAGEVRGCVHPAGTTIVACDPELKSLPFGALNVNVNVAVLPLATDTGLTVMVPSPSFASAASVKAVRAMSPDVPVAVTL
jgi:hypothetical protein